jgi:hypothetical protein
MTTGMGAVTTGVGGMLAIRTPHSAGQVSARGAGGWWCVAAEMPARAAAAAIVQTGITTAAVRIHPATHARAGRSG